MTETLVWLYVVNAALLVVHEMDSVYWREWDLFGLPGGVTGFLALHLPLTAALLYGLVLLVRRSPAGLVFSLILAGSGVFAFSIHLYFIKKGRPEFKAPISLAILFAALIVSLIQGGLAIAALT